MKLMVWKIELYGEKVQLRLLPKLPFSFSVYYSFYELLEEPTTNACIYGKTDNIPPAWNKRLPLPYRPYNSANLDNAGNNWPGGNRPTPMVVLWRCLHATTAPIDRQNNCSAEKWRMLV